jgi:TRAP-type uncharacterized transport system substrate-binding protein
VLRNAWESVIFAAAVALSMMAVKADAQTGFFAGKTVQIIIGFGAGGGYDVWGRTVARHIGKHLPGNPTVVAENMPGAASYVAADHIYSVAPKDGTVMGIIGRTALLGPIIGAEGARFDSTRMSMIGTPTTDTNVCISNSNSEVKTADDLLTNQLTVGDGGAGGGSHSYPAALAVLLGMKFKVITGFAASTDVLLAMERGEVDGFCVSLDALLGERPDWIAQNKVHILFQGGSAPNPELKGVPFILDLARNEDKRRDRCSIQSCLFAGSRRLQARQWAFQLHGCVSLERSRDYQCYRSHRSLSSCRSRW